MKKIYKNVVLSAFSMTSNVIFPLAALPFLANSLGTVEFGEIAIAQAITIFLCQIVDYGFNLSASRRVAGAKNSQEISNIYSITQNARVFLAGFALIIALLLAIINVLPLDSKLLLMTITPAIVGSVFQATWFFQGRGLFAWLAFANFISKLLYLSIVVLFIKNEYDIYLAGTAFGFTYLIGGIILLLAAIKSGVVWKLKVPITELKLAIVRSTHNFLSLLLLSFHSQALIALVGIVISPAAAGLLLMTDKIIRCVSAVTIPIATALFPIFSQLYIDCDKSVDSIRRRAAVGLMTISLICTFFIFFTSHQIANLMMPEEKILLAFYLRLASPIPIFLTLGVLYGGLTLIPSGHDKVYLKAILLAEIFTFIIFLLIQFYYPDMAGIFSMISAEVAIGSLMFLLASVKIRNKNLYKSNQ